MKTDRTEVLVVGAGPVGLLTAILLAEAGIKVKIIDREDRPAARSYACALHSPTIQLLDRLGLAEPLMAQGRPIHGIAFYDGDTRCAEIKLSALGGKFPFLLVLPQSSLEEILEQRLLRSAGVRVKWNHRFAKVEPEDEDVVATVEKLGGTALGYIVPHWETVVQKEISIRAKFLVGADGHNSLVRQRLGIEYDRLDRAEAFVACEFTSDTKAEPEIRIVLDVSSANVLWPLPNNEFRWTFQLIHSEGPHDFPEKDRRALRAMDIAFNDRIRDDLASLIRRRAPWFSANVKEVTWCKQVLFEPRLARRFGEGRCWLAGDTAHQTGPIGVQSLNVGLREADELAAVIRKILQEEAPIELLASYDRERNKEWSRLLGLAKGLRAGNETLDWMRKRSDRILPCLPASGDDLARLSKQLGLDFV
jgi:2-polyprenyl-6-methoxyphenol hydroxylase-like FAD-dependent oxidoreductase